MAFPLLSTFVTGVEPGLWLHSPFWPLRYQWKSFPGQMTSATRWPSSGQRLSASGSSMSWSFWAAGRTEAQVSAPYMAPAAWPGWA